MQNTQGFFEHFQSRQRRRLHEHEFLWYYINPIFRHSPESSSDLSLSNRERPQQRFKSPDSIHGGLQGFLRGGDGSHPRHCQLQIRRQEQRSEVQLQAELCAAHGRRREETLQTPQASFIPGKIRES